MKAVLMSIRPEQCMWIACGKKTTEIRKARPRLKPPFVVHIYCTEPDTNDPHRYLEIHSNQDRNISKGNGKVIGEFVCDDIKEYKSKEPPAVWAALMHAAHVNGYQIEKYADGKTLYGWHISGLKIYDKPKNLEEFNRPNVPSVDEVDDLCDCCRATCGENLRCTEDLCLDAYRKYIQAYFMIKRPPASWCYVEELEG